MIVFVKDPTIKKISPNSDTSNSDSGRGHSSEEGGDTLHRVQSVGRDQDSAPTSSLATVAKDVRSLSNDDDADGRLPFLCFRDEIPFCPYFV